MADHKTLTDFVNWRAVEVEAEGVEVEAVVVGVEVEAVADHKTLDFVNWRAGRCGGGGRWGLGLVGLCMTVCKF